MASGPGSVQVVSPSARARGRVEASACRCDGRALLFLLGTGLEIRREDRERTSRSEASRCIRRDGYRLPGWVLRCSFGECVEGWVVVVLPSVQEHMRARSCRSY